MTISLVSPLRADNPTATDWSVGQAYGCGAALFAHQLHLHRGRPVVVIAPSVAAAEVLEEELRFFAGAEAVCHIPDPEVLPYDSFSPHPDLVSRRLKGLARLSAGKAGIILLAVGTLLSRVPPRDFIARFSLTLEQGAAMELEELAAQLGRAGYVRVSQVAQPGDFAVRGSLIDLFPIGLAEPIRVDFFDAEIDSLRQFDVETQRSGLALDRFELLPARDFPVDADAIKGFRGRYRARFAGNPADSLIYSEVSAARFPGGIENYYPLFFDSTCTLWDYLPAEAIIVSPGDTSALLDMGWQQAQVRHEQYRHDRERPALQPHELFVPPDEHREQIRRHEHVRLHRQELPDRDGGNLTLGHAPAVLINTHAAEPITELQQFVQNYDGRVLLAAESPGRRELLIDLLQHRGLKPQPVADWTAFLDSDAALGIVVAPLSEGVVVNAMRACIIAEKELFGARPARRRRRKTRDPEAILSDLSDLRPGSPVVHEEYGVGRYRGLSHLVIDDIPTEFLTLEYADGDLLHVPVGSLQLISRYSGSAPEHAPLHRLGTDQWAKARRKAAEQIRDIAAEMLDLYGTRAARKGRSMRANPADYERFAAGFPFELTDDQDAAITATLADMAKPQSMDRLICGDVGFGKTEVAMRAAFVAAISGYQVAILAPTTLLAQQHYQNFCDRFADWPINIEVLSRFRTAAEARDVVASVAAGKTDIVIGTHRLLQTDIAMHKLGLVIIDEEHRFGVKHKERLKQLRTEVDILTLTATPIPRTLNMALGQLRELSLITTPPESRLSIKTFVTQWRDAMLQEACQRELQRGGQVYFVHNRVQDIEKIAERLRGIMPDAEIRVAHGQMREQELEQIMLDFYHRRFHILVCTTIIESGIDIPSANTIVINRADRFGLAQLHQLRGRVGRSHHKAFAYLLAPPAEQLTPDAGKRLDAIEAMEDLGAGFVLATHDLEIRGAGELLGESQTGQLQQIGFSLYTELLSRAVAAIRRGDIPALETSQAESTEVNLHVPALLPEDYMPDVQMRLMHYKRIASAPDTGSLQELQVELIDRFGLLPESARNLFRQAQLRLQAMELGIRKVECTSGGATIQFGSQPNVDAGVLVRMISGDPQRYRFDRRQRFVVVSEMPDSEERFACIEQLLDSWLATGTVANAATAIV
ncbi:MAG: transcription-repair coupling factor [Gammaproteobacteria bacterium]|jgi:transcription-repair coupling factor (superfamily II helicase)|nr:transcription-repair coupling factor [Gammaproteobacteria bacterium]